MGCDIHIAVEAFDGERWRAVPDAYDLYGWRRRGDRDRPDDRVYSLFALLAGVRSSEDGDGLFGGRGLPEDWDVSGFAEWYLTATHKEWPGDDESGPDIGEHSFSWALASELLTVDWTEVGPQFQRWLHGPRMTALIHEHGADKVRMVFGFDS